jgi:hypothetical protein
MQREVEDVGDSPSDGRIGRRQTGARTAAMIFTSFEHEREVRLDSIAVGTSLMFTCCWLIFVDTQFKRALAVAGACQNTLPELTVAIAFPGEVLQSPLKIHPAMPLFSH